MACRRIRWAGEAGLEWMSGGRGGSLAQEILALEAFRGTPALEGLGGEPLAGGNMVLETGAT